MLADGLPHPLHQREIDLEPGLRHALARRGKTGGDHCLDRLRKPWSISRVEVWKVPLQQEQVFREKLAFGRLQGFRPRIVEHDADPAETVAGQVELHPVEGAPFTLQLVGQRHDEGNSGAWFQRYTASCNPGGASIVDGDDPVIDRVAAYQSPWSRGVETRGRDMADHHAAQSPHDIAGRKALAVRVPRRRVEDGPIPIVPSLELLRSRQQMRRERLGRHGRVLQLDSTNPHREAMGCQ